MAPSTSSPSDRSREVHREFDTRGENRRVPGDREPVVDRAYDEPCSPVSPVCRCTASHSTEPPRLTPPSKAAPSAKSSSTSADRRAGEPRPGPLGRDLIDIDRRVRFEEAGAVREHDGLDAVAEVELLEDVRDV